MFERCLHCLRVGGTFLLIALPSGDAPAADLVPCFLPAVVVFPENVHTTAAGDFNNDQLHDLVLTLPVRGSVGLLLGEGAGRFGKLTEFAVGPETRAVVSADFNEDNYLDLAVTHSTQISILLGNVAGGFVSTFTYPGGVHPSSLVVGDFNEDHNLDLAVGESTSILVLLGDGTGAFVGSATYPMGNYTIFSIAVADFNLDARQDLVTQLDFLGQIVVLLGNGDGTFGSPRYFAAGAIPVSVAVGDFNVDGRPDVVVANQGGPNISILFGDGAGGFRAPTGFGSGLGARSVVVADFNFDHHLDVAVTNENENSVLVFAGDGFGSLMGPFRSPAGLHPRSLQVVHVDHDGRPDLVITNEGSLSVARNGLTLSPAPPDTLPNGTVGVPFPSTSFTVVGGTPPYSFSVTGALPPGIDLSPTGTLSGTPAQAGKNYFFVSARSAEGCSATGPYTLVVVPIGTSLQLASSANPAFSGQMVTLTATVRPSPPSTGTPTGVVTFHLSSGIVLGTVPLNEGVATLSLTNLPVGTALIGATYGGDGNFLPSGASAISQGIVAPEVPTLELPLQLVLGLLLAAAGIVLARNAR